MNRFRILKVEYNFSIKVIFFIKRNTKEHDELYVSKC